MKNEKKLLGKTKESSETEKQEQNICFYQKIVKSGL
jgi:hypothetical protein